MSTLPRHWISPEEYVDIEQKLGIKHEYHDGQMFAMAGGSIAHSRLQVRLASLVESSLPAPCTAYSSDLRVVVAATTTTFYPDLSIVCGPVASHPAFRHSCTNPAVLFEVLSPSTERYDRGAKFEEYSKIPSLQEYVLVSASSQAIDTYRRQPDGRWLLTRLRGEEALLELSSAGIAISLKDIYQNVPLEEAELNSNSSE